MNTEYRTKLFDHWPTYLEDFSGEVGKKIMGYRYPDNLVETFAKLNLDKNVKIIDIASVLKIYLISSKTMDIPMWMVWIHLKD